MSLFEIGGYGFSRDVSVARSNINELQRQLVTGKKAETYKGLGTDRSTVLSIRARINSLNSYDNTIEQSGIRLQSIQTHLARFNEITSDTRTEGLTSQYEIVNGTQTQNQVLATERLNEMLALLNFEIAGRYFFGGTQTDAPPIETQDKIINGDGARAGLTQIISERNQADLGADGRGRLVLPVPGGAAVSLTEDVNGSPFGLKLASITSTLTGSTATQPTGSPPALSLTFTASLPQDGEVATIRFSLPDGSEESISLTARTAGPVEAGEFLVGADENATAANFQSALDTAIQTLAATKLSAASAVQAADEFFSYDNTTPPQRVAGPPFNTATALTNGSTTDTVYWYKGDLNNDPRGSWVAKVDDALNVSYGVRADEQPIARTVKMLALLSVEQFSVGNVNDEARYNALNSRVIGEINGQPADKTVLDLIGEMGFKQDTINKAEERHSASRLASQELLDKFEGADSYEVSAQLLRLQTQIEASYRTTSILSNLTLTNFI